MIYNEYVDNFINEIQNIRSFNGKIKHANAKLTKIGSGTGRAVYDIDDKVVLKLAKNPKGQAQNEAESGAGTYQDTQDIVTKVFDFDENQYTWILSEKAKKVTQSRIKELTGIPDLNSLLYYLKRNDQKNWRDKDLFTLDAGVEEEMHENEFVMELIEFVNNYSQEVGDMGRPSTYGEVLRYGQPTIVLTDYGLNDEVYNTHYNPLRNKKNQMYELYNFADGNDDILSDIGNTWEVRHGMWAQVPYSVDDGDNDSVINEDFVHFVSNNDNLTTQPLGAVPYMVENLHAVVNNIKENLNVAKDKKKFYNNLITLQDHLIKLGFYNREPLNKIEIIEKKKSINEGIERNLADKIANVVAEKYGVTLEYMDSGSFGSAYDIGNNLVLKVTSDRSEAYENLSLIGKELKYIAEPYKVYSIKTEGDKDYYVIILEKLKTDVPYFEKMLNRLNYVFDNIFNINYRIALEEYFHNTKYVGKVNKSDIDNYFNKNTEDGTFFFSLLKIFEELQKYGSESTDFYSPKNLGYKKDGSIGFFDVGFGNYYNTSDKQPEQLNVDEDGTALYSTDGNIGNDGFPSYDITDTSPSIENDLKANSAMYAEDLEYNHVDDATSDSFIMSERITSSMKGSSSVEVKDKCKLGGLGNTSVACNQGDISNLNIKPLKETIDASEAYHAKDAMAAMVNGKKDVGFFNLKGINSTYLKYAIINNQFKDIPIEQTNHNDDRRIIYRDTPEAERKAKRLVEILKSYGGYFKNESPEITIEIGRLLDYSEESIQKYVNKRYNLEPELNIEGVGDKYLERRHGMKPEFDDFEKDFKSQKNREDGEKIVYKDENVTIIKNPNTLDNIGQYVRGVIDKEGNLYIEESANVVHNVILDKLDKLGLINFVERWDKKLPTEFITVQRLGSSTAFFLGESNVMMKDPEDRFDEDPYWKDVPKIEEGKPVFEEFLRRAKQKNPKYDFRNVLINEGFEARFDEKISKDNDSYLENDNFAKNNEMKTIDEADLMSLEDLPFKGEVEELGGKIFSVGGAVRDGFLGKESKDLDILITGVAFDKLEQLLSKYGRVDAVGKSFGVLKFKPKGSTEDIDIAIPRTEKATGVGGHKGFEVSSDHELPIEKDLERRDFTINAIAKDVNGDIIDPYGGQEDLKNKIIRVVNPEAFADDPLRMLRAVQFSSRFNFTIEPNTMGMIQKNSERIKEIPPERVITEFDKIVTKGNIRSGAQLLKDTGLFNNIFGFDIKQSTIDRSPFDLVKTMGEFIYLLTRLLENPAEFYKNNLKGDIDTYKEIRALDLGLSHDVTNKVSARSIAHNMFVISPKSLQSKIIPTELQNAANELLQGKYPKTTAELAVNGNDLMNAGLKGKEIGDMQKSLLLKVYNDKVLNNKEELLSLVNKNESTSVTLNESKTEKVEYGVLMLSLDIPKWSNLTSKIDKDDIYEVNGEFGIENEPHVTALYGFKDNVTNDDVFNLYKENFDLKEIKIKVNKISIFENEDFDVVKFDVESELLNKINSVMKKLPNVSTFPNYHPHITIAYVKKGKGKKYVKDFTKKYEMVGNELIFSTKEENATILKLDESKQETMLESSDWDGDVLYSCVLLDETSHKQLLSVFGKMIPEGWKEYAHHMTLNMGRIDPKYEQDLGKEVELNVINYGLDDKVMAVGVSGYPTNNKIPHVTLAVNTKNGGKPFMSNKLTDWRKIQFSFKLKGVVTEIMKSQPLQESKKKTKYKNTKESLMRSKNISKDMKEKISKYLTGGSSYHEGGRVHGLSKPKGFTEKTSKSAGVSLGADKKGFYCYTHRAACKRYASPEDIPVKAIEFIESTG